MPVLSDQEANLLASVAALLNDDEAKKRALDLQHDKEAADDAYNRALVQQQVTQRLMAQAEQKDRAADEKMAAAQALMDEANKKEAAVGEVRTALNDEKADFERVRAEVNKQHDERDRSLTERDAAVTAREQNVADMMRHHTDLGAALDARQKALDDAIGKLKAAMAGLEEPHA